MAMIGACLCGGAGGEWWWAIPETLLVLFLAWLPCGTSLCLETVTESSVAKIRPWRATFFVGEPMPDSLFGIACQRRAILSILEPPTDWLFAAIWSTGVTFFCVLVARLAAQRSRDLASNSSRTSGKVADGEGDVAGTKRTSERNAESFANVTPDSRARGWAFAVEDLTHTRLAPRNYESSSHTLGSSQGKSRLLKAQTERLPAEGAVLRSSSHIAATLSKQISELRKNLAEEEAISKENVTKQTVQYELTLGEQRNVTAALVHRIENLNDQVHALTQEVAQLHLQALRLRDTGQTLREEFTELPSNMSTGQEFLKLAMMPPDDHEAESLHGFPLGLKPGSGHSPPPL